MNTKPFRSSTDSCGIPAFIKNIGNKVHYNKDEIIIDADDRIRDIYILLSGKAKQYIMSDKGREKILFILKPGDIIGDISLFEQSKAGFFVEAIQDLDLIHLTEYDLKEKMQKYPELNLYILSSLSRKAKYLVDQLENTCFKDAETRLCELLIQLAFYEGELDENCSRITLRTNQQFISDMLGINRITTVKIIKNLKLMGLLDVQGTRYIINNLSLLELYCNC